MKKIFFCFSFLLLIKTNLPAQQAEIKLLRRINLDRNKSLDPIFKTITNSVPPVCVGLPLSMFTVSLFNNDKNLQQQSIYVGITFLASSFVSTGLKYSFNRKRPFVTYPEIDKQTSESSPSFPSGYTSSAFSTATAISLTSPKWFVIAPSFLWAGAVGYSRLHLGVHYPSDVLAGALIGAGTSFLCYKINQKINSDEVQ
jgi:membrane-associated phospholipid phosphatase